MNLTDLGWTSHFDEQFRLLNDPLLEPARVALPGSPETFLLTPDGPARALTARAFPVVGDWVATERLDADQLVIRAVLPRHACLERQASGARKSADAAAAAQPLAANVDVAFLVSGLDRDFNPRRIERYATLAYNCGVTPVVVLNKADLHPDPEAVRAEVETSLPGTTVLLLSVKERQGIEELLAALPPRRTGCLLGSSGVGKSSLLNLLLGEERAETRTVGQGAGKGRHTTSHRELFALPSGAWLIDTPGLREIGLAGEGEGLDRVFSDIAALAENCRFRDCGHREEPGCAVREAVQTGALAPERLASFHKLRKEMYNRALIDEHGADGAERVRWKAIRKIQKKLYK